MVEFARLIIYNLLPPCCCFFANALKSFLKIFPDGLLGTAAKNTTPPLNFL